MIHALLIVVVILLILMVPLNIFIYRVRWLLRSWLRHEERVRLTHETFLKAAVHYMRFIEQNLPQERYLSRFLEAHMKRLKDSGWRLFDLDDMDALSGALETSFLLCDDNFETSNQEAYRKVKSDVIESERQFLYALQDHQEIAVQVQVLQEMTSFKLLAPLFFRSYRKPVLVPNLEFIRNRSSRSAA